MLDKISKETLKKTEINNYDLNVNDLKGSFIPTEKAKERLQKLKEFFDSKIPILLEGPTGTSKTKSIQVLCEILKKN